MVEWLSISDCTPQHPAHTRYHHCSFPTPPLFRPQPGQHTRELNPYWKDGGSGVPENKPPAASSTPPAPSAAGDGGLSWLRKAYDRCKQQAQDEGRSLEDVVADRYGVSVGESCGVSVDKIVRSVGESCEVSG